MDVIISHHKQNVDELGAWLEEHCDLDDGQLWKNLTEVMKHCVNAVDDYLNQGLVKMQYLKIQDVEYEEGKADDGYLRNVFFSYRRRMYNKDGKAQVKTIQRKIRCPDQLLSDKFNDILAGWIQTCLELALSPGVPVIPYWSEVISFFFAFLL